MSRFSRPVTGFLVGRLSYADDVYDKAVGLMQDGGEGAVPAYPTYPTAKAFYYYVRICLVPPPMTPVA